jgi:niacin transporter
MYNFLALPLIKIKTLFFILAFTALSVITPIVFHFFGGINAGRLFLPIQFFVFAAALLLGWREGLAVGILTPLVSYFVSGMPTLPVLPLIVIELAAYGLICGLLQEKLKNIWLSLFGAVILGRMVLWLAILALPTSFTGQYVIGAVEAGWIGILLQIIFVPLFVKFSQKFLNERI